MNQHIRTTYPKSRKEYFCESSEWLINDHHYLSDIGDLTFAEKRVLAKARMNKWKIQKGEKYMRITGTNCDGKIYDSKVIPEIDAICRKYDAYDYDHC